MEETREMFGNGPSRSRTEGLLLEGSRTSVAAIAGPTGLGKRSFLELALAKILEESDLLSVEPDVDGAREASSFLRSDPLFSPYRAVVVDRAESLSDPAQDAYLRLCEEPPPSARIFFVTSDEGLLLPALRSRIQEVVRWRPLDGPEMDLFLGSRPAAPDPWARAACRGIPGLYEAMDGRPEFPVLHAAVSGLVTGASDPLSLPVPEAVSSLPNKPVPARTAVSSVCRQAAVAHVGTPGARARIRAFLSFSATLVRHPAASAEMHWQRAAVLCSL